MMRAFFLLAGVAFGFVLIQSGVSNYDFIREMFLFQSIHMYGVLAIAVGLSFIATHIFKAMKLKPLLSDEPLEINREKPGKEHLVGGLLAGFGWALTGACPGPALAQMGFGTLAGIFTFTGILLGVFVFGATRRKS